MHKRVAAILSWVCVIPVGCRPESEPLRAEPPEVAMIRLAEEDIERLAAAGWRERVGDGLGLWVSVERQTLFVIEGGRSRFACRCSTAAKGTGNREGSNQTPLGWHEIRERFGDGLPVGAIFKERKYTGKTWRPGDADRGDLILSRILWLAGLEAGLNAGPGIDSHARYIYIHGTPEEDKLGRPASMGCIRLSNQDMVELFQQAPTGMPVLISAW